MVLRKESSLQQGQKFNLMQFQITITEVNKVDKFPRGYIVYSIQSRLNDNTCSSLSVSKSSAIFCVQRRYHDFIVLDESIRKSIPGIILPSIPRKIVLGNFDEGKILNRRKHLDMYIIKLASHKLLSNNMILNSFLTVSGDWYSSLGMMVDLKNKRTPRRTDNLLNVMFNKQVKLCDQVSIAVSTIPIDVSYQWGAKNLILRNAS